MKTKLNGTYVAIVTPFSGDDPIKKEINLDSLDILLNKLYQEKVEGIVVAGSTGSDSLLPDDYHVKLGKYVHHSVLLNMGFSNPIVIAGDGSNSTVEAIELAKKIEGEAGIFLHLSKSPYYNKPSDEGIRKHFECIADNIKGELVLYSIPGRTGGKGIPPYVVEKLADHPNIIGLKDANGNLEWTQEIIERTKDKDFFVLSGDDGATLDIMKLGGQGVISVTANLYPSKMRKLVEYALKKDYGSAEKLNDELTPLYNVLFPKPKMGEFNAPPNPETVHYALNKLGIDVGYPPLPLMVPGQSYRDDIDNVLNQLSDD